METSPEFPVTCSTEASTSLVSEGLDSHCIYQWTPEAFVTEGLTVDQRTALQRTPVVLLTEENSGWRNHHRPRPLLPLRTPRVFSPLETPVTESLPASALLFTSCHMQCYHGRLRPSSLSPGGSLASEGRTVRDLARVPPPPPPPCACPQPVGALAPRRGSSQTPASPDEAALGATRAALGPVPTASPVALRMHAGLRLLSVAPLPRTSLRLVIGAAPAGPTTAKAPQPRRGLLSLCSAPARTLPPKLGAQEVAAGRRQPTPDG